MIRQARKLRYGKRHEGGLRSGGNRCQQMEQRGAQRGDCRDRRAGNDFLNDMCQSLLPVSLIDYLRATNLHV